MDSNTDWELMARYIAKECTDEQRDAFESWLQLNENNRDIYNKTLISWESADSFKAHPNPRLVWEKIEKNLKKPAKLVKINPWTKVMKVAALVLLTVGVSYLIYTSPLIDETRDQTYSFVSNTSEGIQEVVLSEGTHVWLNAGGTLKYPEHFESNTRKVILKGEAFFDVSRDESRPFIIEAGTSIVKVLGTSFNVNAKKADRAIIVNVSSGKVALSSQKGNDEIILKRGDQGMLNVRSGGLKKIQNADPNILSWKTGIVTFEKSSLNYVMAVLEKHYDIQVESRIPKEKSKEMLLTATFEDQNLKKVIEVINYALNINVITEGEMIIFAE